VKDGCWNPTYPFRVAPEFKEAIKKASREELQNIKKLARHALEVDMVKDREEDVMVNRITQGWFLCRTDALRHGWRTLIRKHGGYVKK